MHETTKLARRHAVDRERSFRFFLGQRTRFIFLPPHRWLRSWPPGPHRPSCSRYATGPAACDEKAGSGRRIPCVCGWKIVQKLCFVGAFFDATPSSQLCCPLGCELFGSSTSGEPRSSLRSGRARLFPRRNMQARLPMEDAEMFPQSSSLNFSRTCDLHRLAVALAVILR